MPTLILNIDVNDKGTRKVRVFREETGRAGRALDNTGRSAKATSRELVRVGDGADRATAGYRNLTRAAAAAFSIESGRRVVQAADTYALLSSRIGLVTDSYAEQARVEKELLAISQRTRSSLEGTATIFTRIGQSRKELGRSVEDLLRFTEQLNKLTIVSGAQPQEARNAIIQLSQGLASGELRGEELRSVMEQLPAVARAVSDSLGVTIGQFREMAHEGEITAQVVIDAILGAEKETNRAFEQMATTAGQAFEKVKSAALVELGGVDTGAVVGGLESLAENMDKVVAAGEALIAVGVARYLGLVSKQAYASAAGALAEARAVQAGTAARAAAARQREIEIRQQQAGAGILAQGFVIQARGVTGGQVRAHEETRLRRAVLARTLAERKAAAATGASAAAMAAASTAGRGLAAAYTLIGGPVGLGILAGFAVSKLTDALKEQAIAADQAQDALNELYKQRFAGITGPGPVAQTRDQIAGSIVEVMRQLDELEAARDALGPVDPLSDPTGAGARQFAALNEEIREANRQLPILLDALDRAPSGVEQAAVNFAEQWKNADQAMNSYLEDLRQANREQELINAGLEDEVAVIRAVEKAREIITKAGKEERLTQEQINAEVEEWSGFVRGLIEQHVRLVETGEEIKRQEQERKRAADEAARQAERQAARQVDFFRGYDDEIAKLTDILGLGERRAEVLAAIRDFERDVERAATEAERNRIAGLVEQKRLLEDQQAARGRIVELMRLEASLELELAQHGAERARAEIDFRERTGRISPLEAERGRFAVDRRELQARLEALRAAAGATTDLAEVRARNAEYAAIERQIADTYEDEARALELIAYYDRERVARFEARGLGSAGEAAAGARFGFQESLAAAEDFFSFGKAAAEDLFSTMEQGSARALASFIRGTASAEDAFTQFGNTVLDTLAQIIAEFLVLKAIQAGVGFFGGGGGFSVASSLLEFHDGGVVSRGGLRQDEVVAKLQEGEGVLSRRGMATLADLNAGRMPAGGGGSGSSAPAQNAVTIINVDDPKQIQAYMSTREGEAVILNAIRRDLTTRGPIYRELRGLRG